MKSESSEKKFILLCMTCENFKSKQGCTGGCIHPNGYYKDVNQTDGLITGTCDVPQYCLEHCYYKERK